MTDDKRMTQEADGKKLQGARVMVVEDDPELGRMVAEEIQESGHTVENCQSAEEAFERLSRRAPDVILSDLYLPGEDGTWLLRQCQSLPWPPSFLMITAFGTIPEAVEALKIGADNFLTKPLDFDHLAVCLERALEVRRLKMEIREFRRSRRGPEAYGLLGDSKPMQFLFYQMRQIAQAKGAVLITGESGVGKELVAHGLHEHSDRCQGPFIPVNCAGIPADLLESELFGHTAGAFTGANRGKKGLFDAADGGTIFLDELAELPAGMQAKLLRTLQNHCIRPVGSNQERAVDVRVIGATNRKLEEEIRAGRLREDLYYRLETFTIRVPPLREREADLDLLAARFLAQYAEEIQKPVTGFSAEALKVLRDYPYPGNVRELQNIIKRAVTFCQTETIQRSDLPEGLRASGASNARLPSAAAWGLASVVHSGNELPPLEDVKLRYVRYVLNKTQGNKRRAAEILGIGRHTLYHYLEKLPE